MVPTGHAIATEGSVEATAKPKPRLHLARRDIQGLRAVAVIVVIVDHALGWPAGGFVGVDIFFVISGYLITGLLLREYDRSGRISIADFYRRRARRILPVSWAVLSVTLFVALLLFSAVRFDSTAVDAFWALIFSINWHLALVGTDYMQAAGPVSPLQHFWSLAVEEQFYVVWPLLLLFALWATRKVLTRRKGPAVRVTRRAAAGVIVAVCIASFGWALHETVSSPTFAYFSTFSRAWELGLGALLAVVAARLTRMPSTARIALAWTGLAGIAVSLFVVSPDTDFPAPGAVLPVVAAVLVLASGIGIEARFVGILTNRVSVYLGDISYSLYLWHFPVIIFVGVLFPAQTPVTVVAVLATTLALSAFSYHFIEDPVRRSQWLDARAGRRKDVDADPPSRRRRIAWLSALGVVSVTLIAMAFAFNGALKTPSPSIVVAAAPIAGVAQMSATEARTAEIAQALSARTWPATEPAIDALDKDAGAKEWVTDSCLNIYSNTRDSCIYGDPQAAKTAVLLGDSTAVSYLPGLLPALTAQGYKVHVLTMFSCPAYDIPVGPVGSEAAHVCDLQHQWVYGYVEQLHPDLVLMSSLAGTVVKLASNTGAEESLAEYGNAAAATVQRMATASARVVVIGPPPGADKPVTECKTATNTPSDCVNTASTLYRKVVEVEKASVATVPDRAQYVDVMPWLCNGTSCPAFIGTAPVSWDGIHLTDAASSTLTPLFADALFGPTKDAPTS